MVFLKNVRLSMLPSKKLFYSTSDVENIFFVTNVIYVSGMELQKCLRCGIFIPHKVNYWRRKELIIFLKGFKHDLNEADQSQYESWPFNDKLEITISFT